jgi:hypothetical protein
MKCKECKSDDWTIVWGNALKEEGQEVDMVQCNKCKRVVMVTSDYFYDKTTEA